jgi:hypothetical protein
MLGDNDLLVLLSRQKSDLWLGHPVYVPAKKPFYFSGDASWVRHSGVGKYHLIGWQLFSGERGKTRQLYIFDWMREELFDVLGEI